MLPLTPPPPTFINLVQTVQEEKKPEVKKKKPVTYVVVRGDNLERIAKKYKTSVQRIYNKNIKIKHPDVIKEGHRLVIPFPKEKLKHRPFGIKKASTATQRSSNSTSTGINGYYEGQCTAFVALKRHVPPGWGDASNWKASALAAGWTVSSKPVAGAIGWRWGHVVFVEKVLPGGMIRISEQNYDWNSGIRTIDVPVRTYSYIY